MRMGYYAITIWGWCNTPLQYEMRMGYYTIAIHVTGTNMAATFLRAFCLHFITGVFISLTYSSKPLKGDLDFKESPWLQKWWVFKIFLC